LSAATESGGKDLPLVIRPEEIGRDLLEWYHITTHVHLVQSISGCANRDHSRRSGGTFHAEGFPSWFGLISVVSAIGTVRPSIVSH